MTARAKNHQCPACVVAEAGDPPPPLTLDHVIIYVCQERSEHLLCKTHMLRSLVLQFPLGPDEPTQPTCHRCDEPAEILEPTEDGELCFCEVCYAAYEEEVAS